MRKILVFFFLLTMACFSTAWGSDGMTFEVVNRTGRSMNVQMETSSWDFDRSFNRQVEAGQTIRIDKSETKHYDGEIGPYWQITFNGRCKYKFRSVGKNKCEYVVGMSDCALIEGSNCNIKFSVAE